MPSFTRVISAATLSIGVLAAACAPDAEPAVAASEHGRWQMLAATRDGGPTALLDSAYFAFDTAAARLTTNLLGEDVAMAYRIEETAVVTDGPVELQRFALRELTDSTLVMTTTIQGSEFEFELRPAGQ